jgi:hypothetical protein
MPAAAFQGCLLVVHRDNSRTGRLGIYDTVMRPRMDVEKADFSWLMGFTRVANMLSLSTLICALE